MEARVAPTAAEQTERKSPMRVALTVASAVGLVALSVRGASVPGAPPRGPAAPARIRCSQAPRRERSNSGTGAGTLTWQTVCAGACLRLADRPHGARFRPRGRRDRVARRPGGWQRGRGQKASDRTEPRWGQPRRPQKPVVQRAPMGPVEPRGHAHGRRPPHLGRQNVRGGGGCPAATAQSEGGHHAKPRAGVRCGCRTVLSVARCIRDVSAALRVAPSSRSRCSSLLPGHRGSEPPHGGRRNPRSRGGPRSGCRLRLARQDR